MIILLGFIIVIPLSAYLGIKSNYIQQHISRFLSDQAAQSLDTKITFSNIHYTFPNQLTIKDFILFDQQDRPFIVIEEGHIGILFFSAKRRAITLSNVDVKKGAFNLYQDSTGIINGEFFFDAIKQNDTTRTPFLVTIHKLTSDSLSFRFLQEDATAKSTGIHFGNLLIQINNLKANDFQKDSQNEITFRINQMRFIEQCGFLVESLQGDVRVSDTTIRLENSIIHTPQSNLYINHFVFLYDHYQSFGDGGIINDVQIQCQMDDSDLHTKDLYLLGGIFKDYHQVFKVSTSLDGSINKLRASNLDIRHGEDIRFQGDIDIDGLPETQEIFLFSSIKELTLSKEGLERASIEQLFKQKIELPAVLDNLGVISYTGNFTGFLDDFVAYGTIHSNIGIISTDIAIQPDSLKNIHISGSVAGKDFDLGQFMASEDILGKTSLSLNIDGLYRNDKTLNMRAEGMVDKLDFNRYTLTNITMGGDITENYFDGVINIQDPNLDLDFSGLIEYADKDPLFDFSAQINHANLYRLNIDHTDSLSSFYANLKAHFEYDERNMFKGKIRLSDGMFKNAGNTISLKEILLYTLEGKTNQIILKSDYLDGRIVGKYDFTSLPNDFHHFFAHYLSWINNDKLNRQVDQGNLSASLNSFQFDFYIKDAGVLTRYFNQAYYISPNSILKGAFSPKTHTFDLRYKSDTLQIPNLMIEKLHINSLSFSDSLKLQTTIGRITVLDKFSESNISIRQIAKHDSLFSLFQINSIDSTTTKGQLKTLLTRQANENQGDFHFHLHPTTLIIEDTLFHIQAEKIGFDSTSIHFTQFDIASASRYIKLNGTLSDKQEDKLNIAFEHIPLSHVNRLIQTDAVTLAGNTSGIIQVADIRESLYFVADVDVDTLFLNGESLGYTTLKSTWDNEEQLIRINSQSMRNQHTVIALSGIYEPNEKFLHASISLSKLRAHILNPFLTGVLSEIKGIANGYVTLIGPLSNINMDGELTLQRTSFLVDYLNTSYSFTHTLPIRNNELHFKEVTVFDAEGSQGTLNGTIGFPLMRSVELDMKLNTKSLLVLNTNFAQNPDFFGKAYAAGVAEIKGSPGDIEMILSLKTMPNSDISIPIETENSRVDEKKLVTFVSPKKNKEQQKFRSSPTQQESEGFDLSFDLEVTPETRVQLLFDLDVVDVIRASGTGNLSMDINRNGQFEMFGEYVIERGDFWLNLQNLLNKRFAIKQNSSLTWNGDPVNADVNIHAIYKLKASLSNLFGDTTQTYKKRVPVECEVALNGVLTNPEMDFLINLPTVEPETRNKAQVLLDTEEKRSRQFLSLLVFNSFWYEPDAGNAYASQQGDYGAFTASTGSEMLSNQVSSWLSQFSSDVDIGVYYRPGKEEMTDEMEVALSMQLLDEWVSISGHVDMMGQNKEARQSTQSSNNLVGDFEVDVKVNQSGKLRVKAFHRSNDDVWYRNHEYRQGVGLTYREEFESLNSLFRRIFARTEEEEEESTLK